MKDLVITAKRVSGHCSAGIQPGDKIVLRGATISLSESDRVCGFAFASCYPVILAARMGHDLPADLGLTESLVQCTDPGQPYSTGGTVLFEIKPLE
jgi:uncharacterized repeat protein (TIGR04076 family)